MYLNAGLVDEAIRYFEKALIIKQDLTAARLNLAKAQLNRGNLEGAISIYSALLKEHPRRSVVHERWLRLFGQFLPVHKWRLAGC
jgi:tetratricopeptide (TPR) repeat protein